MDLSVPISGYPYLSEFGVAGLVQLALYVGFVGGVSGSDFEFWFGVLVMGGWWVSGGLRVVGEKRKEEREGEKEREKEALGYQYC